ncbi:hypothetical protein THAOC_36795 [Thalassiosira oceanica]|uniref:Uncharacterized protein n=1 Tax=Thalassiosira oceanica TaxID=159749 RepID=K0R7K4_THAOC|nr:hypothetical protein THAOC_36795 [Thalassiosira oceanica]|eukprot:EJK44651.1 hypothetical protein THAOC_36795 [Thalassiosira oceanica]
MKTRVAAAPPSTGRLLLFARELDDGGTGEDCEDVKSNEPTIPTDERRAQDYRTEPFWGGWRDGTTAWSTVVHGSGSDDTTYPPDGAANQDNRTGRTGIRLGKSTKHYCFSVSSINLTLESALPPPALALPSQRRNLHPIPANRDDGQYQIAMRATWAKAETFQRDAAVFRSTIE